MTGNNKCAVSVICNAYNHEKYIEKTLKAFVNQKTTFSFEVLIHDDASTDLTADVIREYERQYPEIIKPIYEIENQYSKHDGSLSRIQYGRAKGKYIAICEGDDYWTDSMKLQRQFDILEKHPNIDICAHKASIFKQGKLVGSISPKNSECIIPIEEVILGGGAYVATNSLMYRREIRSNPLIEIMSIDYAVQIIGALKGGMYYLPECMSVYNTGVEGSWTQKMSSDVEAYIIHNENVKSFLTALNEHTRYTYNDIIDEKIRINQFHILGLQGNAKKMLSIEYRDVFKQQNLRTKLGIIYKVLMKR